MPALTRSVCIVDGHHGAYVPQVWAERYGSQAVQSAGVRIWDVQVLLMGPDDDPADYWDSWDNVLNSYCHTVEGVKHTLSQDGDLFEVPETAQEHWDDC